MLKNKSTEQSLQIFTISELAQMTSDLLDECFSDVWLTGEISNLAIPASGHAYLILKDEKAQLRTVIFKGVYSKIRSLKDGMKVTIWGKLNLYSPRGELQVVARQVMTEGEGPLAIQFERLKQYCTKQGWFSAEHKLTLPKQIKTIGVVTSPTGAALYDVLKVLSRRNPSIEVVVYPTQVQGDLAPDLIVKALLAAQRHQYVDVILLTRGGGSAEDLFCFNDVKVVQAIYECNIPLVSAIGHEVDTTLADWAADVRVATPSAGAEVLSEDISVYRQQLKHYQQRFNHQISRVLQHYKHRLMMLNNSCKSPADKVLLNVQRLEKFKTVINMLMQQKVSLQLKHIKSLEDRLKALNPKSILERGYAMVEDASTGEVISSAKNIAKGQLLKVQFSSDALEAEVISDHGK